MTAPESSTVLVAGAGGVIGGHAADEYAARGATVRGVSRRPVADATREHPPVDLLDAEGAKDGLSSAADTTTHLVFGAHIDKPGAAERGVDLTVLRPEGVTAYAVGNPMNLLMVIAVYAAACRELGQPLRFPGTGAAYDALHQVTDAELLARATVWAGSELFDELAARRVVPPAA